MWVHVSDRRPFLVALVGLIGLAWLALAGWGLSPYARLLDHDVLGTAGDGGVPLVLVAVAGWTVMTVAMMLPTSLPLILLFAGLVRQRPDRGRLVGLLIAGYLFIWTLAGLLVHLGDLGLHIAAVQAGWLRDNTGLLGAATLVLAGLYQFAPLKYRCLEQCRSPFSFVMQHWRGRREQLQTFRLGVIHGLFCVGCCWSLMLLMFAVGTGNLAWMLALGAVMAAEKNLPWGKRLSAPLGVLLLVAGVALAATGYHL
jgi:predicted metal-binding membrane protein